MSSIIITGASSGIGLSLTHHFLSLSTPSTPSRIALLDLNPPADGLTSLSTLYPSAQITFHQADVSSWDSLSSVFSTLYTSHLNNKLDIVIANAGISEQGSTTLINLNQTPESEPVKPKTKVLDVNLYGVIYSINLAVHYMSKNQTPGGHIICTASNAGLYPLPTAPLYAASKFAVVGLVRSTAQLIKSRGIRINGLAPAVLETNIAPSKDLFKHMIVTPMSTLIKGVEQLVNDESLSGEIAEIHGEKVTLRPAHEFVDEDTKKNIDTFWSLGYA
ncbi:hypothetical protein QBC38DRAFT_539751 [Podospora fimiseda]|uniref:Uncharacterized protein n=1 Tax=Podospora fimiseda TaxID=252190 RepID=A0AAN6YT26_9PEZI|nr:hypothetical protein QBC38DRAFT_539751 [Podospora fimiseda]